MSDRTSSQIAKDEAQQAAADDLFAAGFGDAQNVLPPEPEPPLTEESSPPQQESESLLEEPNPHETEPDDDAMAAMLNAASTNGAPMSPPSAGPPPFPEKPQGPPPSGPQMGPPGGPPPSGPMENQSEMGPPGLPPISPSGPPPADQPMGPPGGPPPSSSMENQSEMGPPGPPPGSPSGPLPADQPMGPPGAPSPSALEMGPVDSPPSPTKIVKEPLPPSNDGEVSSLVSQALDLASSSANKIANLEAEIERLRGALTGTAEVISEIEEQPMPPVVGEDYVIPAHMVADFVRIGRQLHREGLVHSDVGAVAILNPDEAGLMHASVGGAIIGQMNEKDITSGRLGQTAPSNAPEEWRILEVLLASKSLETRGPAACLHTHPPYATAISCEQDLIVLKPIDEEGKKHLGNIVIVEPDEENQEEYLRQLAEALKQGNMKAVVVKGHGVFSTGSNFDEAWRWASVIEHSMRVLMHARQANLRV